MFAAFSVSDSLLHICLNSSSCHNVLILLSLSDVTNLSLLIGVCAACMLAYKCLQMKWWAAVTVVAILSQKALLMCPYVSSGKFPVLAPRCSRALLHNLQIPAEKWGDTEIAERGRSMLVMRASYTSAELTPHQRGWTDAG